MEATGNEGLHVIVEMLANVNLGSDLKMLAPGGTVAVVGSRGDVQITPRDLMQREANIVGVMSMFCGFMVVPLTIMFTFVLMQWDHLRNLRRHFVALMQVMCPTNVIPNFFHHFFFLFSKGLAAENLKPVVGACYSLHEAAAAHVEVLEHSKGTNGKVVLQIN